MLKKVMLVCLTFLLIGCVRVDEVNDYYSLIQHCLNDHIVTNDVSVGYRYYVPRGVRKINDYDYNQVFLVDDTSIYLYVDIVSYFYKKEVSHSQSSNSSVYKQIVHGDKKGYFELIEKDDICYVQMLYNYSKIEFYTDKNSLNKMIVLSTTILNSISYNDKVIENVLEGSFGEFSEFNYEVKKPEGANGDFSQYLEEYVQKEKKETKKDLPDEYVQKEEEELKKDLPDE